MDVDIREKTIFFEKYWIGVAKESDAINLVKGQRYLLKDKTGNRNYFEVTDVIAHCDSYFGWYRSEHFEMLEDVTDEILAMPFVRTYQFDSHVSRVRARARNFNITHDEAQLMLINEGIFKKAVVDSEGNPLIQHATLYRDKKVEVRDLKPAKKSATAKKVETANKPVQRGLFG